MKKFINNHYTLLVLSIISGILIVSDPFFAHKVLANTNVTATTDKSSYFFGDAIIISGSVKTVVPGSIVSIRILDPYSNLIQTSEVTVASDDSYTDAIEITGSVWKVSGVYTVQVQYGLAAQTQTIFTYTATTAPTSDTFHLQIPNHQTFDVPYTISGGTVTNMSVNTSDISLTVSIQSNNYGAITLSLSRSLLNSKASDGTDSSFIILIDGAEVKPQKELITAGDRTLTIQFLQGDQEIQIIGTSVESQNSSNFSSANLTTNQQPSTQINKMSNGIPAVPEFSTATILFMIALISIVVLARISRQIRT